MSPHHTESFYKLARERYAALGINTNNVLKVLTGVPVSSHCWRRDDVEGFESLGSELTGGLMTTGDYPGKVCGKPTGHATSKRTD